MEMHGLHAKTCMHFLFHRLDKYSWQSAVHIHLDASGCTNPLALMGYVDQARSVSVFAALDHSDIDLDRGPQGMLVARAGINILGRRAAQGVIRLATDARCLRHSAFSDQNRRIRRCRDRRIAK